MCYPMGCGQVRPLTKQGTPKFVTEAHYILATISLKFRAGITKFQGGVPKALKDGISLVRLAYARTKPQLAAAHRIRHSAWLYYELRSRIRFPLSYIAQFLSAHLT
jgi:hypothetical protein